MSELLFCDRFYTSFSNGLCAYTYDILHLGEGTLSQNAYLIHTGDTHLSVTWWMNSVVVVTSCSPTFHFQIASLSVFLWNDNSLFCGHCVLYFPLRDF